MGLIMTQQKLKVSQEVIPWSCLQFKKNLERGSGCNGEGCGIIQTYVLIWEFLGFSEHILASILDTCSSSQHMGSNTTALSNSCLSTLFHRISHRWISLPVDFHMSGISLFFNFPVSEIYHVRFLKFPKVISVSEPSAPISCKQPRLARNPLCC